MKENTGKTEYIYLFYYFFRNMIKNGVVANRFLATFIYLFGAYNSVVVDDMI